MESFELPYIKTEESNNEHNRIRHAFDSADLNQKLSFHEFEAWSKPHASNTLTSRSMDELTNTSSLPRTPYRCRSLSSVIPSTIGPDLALLQSVNRVREACCMRAIVTEHCNLLLEQP